MSKNKHNIQVQEGIVEEFNKCLEQPGSPGIYQVDVLLRSSGPDGDNTASGVYSSDLGLLRVESSHKTLVPADVVSMKPHVYKVG